MKRFCVLLSCLLLLSAMVTPASAAGAAESRQETIYQQEIDLGGGITLVDEVTVSNQTRATERTAAHKGIFRQNGDVIAVIAFTCTFRYDGSTVSAVSKSVTQKDTYNGWSFSQSSFTSSGGTVSLSGKLKKLLSISVPVEMSLTCDKNGTVSYS